MLEKFLLVLFLPVLLSAQCDQRGCRSYRSSRVLGGDSTEPHSRPFQVALYSRVGIAGPVGFCGGSLIHQEWVLTAAHCCFHHDEQVTHVQAILGAHSLYDRYENGRRVVNVDELVVHPDWDPVTFANDIALMKLANVVQLSETVDIVLLPYLSIAEFSFAGLGAIASGWGIAAPSVSFVSPTLRQKSMTVMTDTFCNSDYLGMLPGNNICGFNPTSGTCRGDNGGPMTIFWNSTEETILVGVTSFVEAIGCNEDHPSVFTRVQRYLSWISEVTAIVLD